jgi:CBS domain-containing protein
MKQIGELIEGRPLFHISTADKVREAARQMTEWNIGAVAVLEDERLAGVFSERDLMARVVAKGLDPDATSVSAVMTKSLVVASPGDDFDDAIQKMHSIGSRHLPVVENGRLIGMISLRDLLEVDDAAQRQKASFLGELVTYSPDYET